jgi:hypothetical protein
MNDTITNESLIRQNDNLSITDPIDSPMFITPYNEYKPQQYSQNATESLTKTNKQDFQFDTAVIIDVTKCSPTTPIKPNLIHQPPIQDNWNYTFPNKEHLTPTAWTMPLLNNYQQELSPIYIPNFDQYPQSETMFHPYSHNSNYTNQQQILTDSIFYNPVSQRTSKTSEKPFFYRVMKPLGFLRISPDQMNCNS